MKQLSVLSFVALLFFAVIFTSCRSGRAYYAQPGPRYHSSMSLIISPNPGFRMEVYRDGRSFYRSPEGFVYWRGYDNRFYLDRRYVNRARYNHWEYDQWNRNQNYRPHRRHR